MYVAGSINQCEGPFYKTGGVKALCLTCFIVCGGICLKGVTDQDPPAAVCCHHIRAGFSEIHGVESLCFCEMLSRHVYKKLSSSHDFLLSNCSLNSFYSSNYVK